MIGCADEGLALTPGAQSLYRLVLEHRRDVRDSAYKRTSVGCADSGSTRGPRRPHRSCHRKEEMTGLEHRGPWGAGAE